MRPLHPALLALLAGCADPADSGKPATDDPASTDTGDTADTAATADTGCVPTGLADDQCDGVDDDCDGADDEDAPSVRLDADCDGYGDGDPFSSCTDTGADCRATAGGDCADDDAAVHPGADEVCNGTDDDCDGAPETVSDEVCDGLDNDCDGDADAEGLVSRFDATGAFAEDLTATFAGSLVTYALPADGTVALCPGTYSVRLTGTGSTAAVTGVHGASVTTLDGAGATSGTGALLELTDGAVTVTGLTLTGGVGTQDGTYAYGGAVFLQATTPATAPNLTLVASVLASNYAFVGGAVAVGPDAWLRAEDSEIRDNLSYVSGGFSLDGGGVLELVDTAVTGNSSVYYGAGGSSAGTITCEADPANAAGIFDNATSFPGAGGGVYMNGGTIDSVDCDWQDNHPESIWTPAGTRVDYGEDATFTCDASGCR